LKEELDFSFLAPDDTEQIMQKIDRLCGDDLK